MQHNTAAYTLALAALLAPGLAQAAPAPEYRYEVPHVDLEPAEALISAAAGKATDIIFAHERKLPSISTQLPEPVRFANWCIACDARLETYIRAAALRDEGHLDNIETAIAIAILREAEQLQGAFPSAATDEGLALLDMHLREAALAIKPSVKRRPFVTTNLIRTRTLEDAAYEHKRAAAIRAQAFDRKYGHVKQLALAEGV